MNKLNKQTFPWYGWMGAALVSVSWIINWTFPGLRTHWAFFPLWLGYCITVDALVFYRTGSSLIKRGVKKFLLLFLISIPCWWLFEFFNLFTNNWYYEGKQYFSDFQFLLLGSLSFSTVMPAVFETAEFMSSFKWIDKFKNRQKFAPSKNALLIYLIAGVLIAILILTLPGYFYPLIWVSLYLIIEPINAFLGHRTILDYTSSGDWSLAASLALGTLVCGFFWEMWNYYSYPKWFYNLPGVNFLHIFEMPALGFIGYIPFSFELFAMYNFLEGIATKTRRY